VVFDVHGRIVGGAAESLSRAARRLPPGETAGFAINVLAPTGSRRAIFAAVSIDP